MLTNVPVQFLKPKRIKSVVSAYYGLQFNLFHNAVAKKTGVNVLPVMEKHYPSFIMSIINTLSLVI